MIKTVDDLIKALEWFNPNMPVCIRKVEVGGRYSDWSLRDPDEFYPGGKICLSAFEQLDDEKPASDKE